MSLGRTVTTAITHEIESPQAFTANRMTENPVELNI